MNQLIHFVSQTGKKTTNTKNTRDVTNAEDFLTYWLAEKFACVPWEKKLQWRLNWNIMSVCISPLFFFSFLPSCVTAG